MSGHLRALVLLVALVAAGCSRVPSASAPTGTARPSLGASAGDGARVAGAPGLAPRTSSRAARGEAVRSARLAQPEALWVLHGWDRRRARAYAAGSPAALRALYVPGSGAGRADVRLLRAYVARGYRVEGMRMQVLGFRVLAHAPGRWRLLVTDRLERAVAVRDGVRVPLPRDRASTREVNLVREDDGVWQIAAVSRER